MGYLIITNIMVFKRKKKLTIFKNLKSLFFPERGWRRAIEYISHRIRRLPDTPHRIALGLSFGVLASFSPLFGFHFLLGAFLAYLFSANVFASILGTFFGNPITFPFIQCHALALKANLRKDKNFELFFTGRLRSMLKILIIDEWCTDDIEINLW